MNMDIWEVPKLKKKKKKRKLVVTGKTPFFVLPILFVLTLASDRAVLKGNVMLSILVFLTKKRYSNFLKSLCFLENLFQS